MTPWLWNTAWMWHCRPEARRLASALRNVAATQEALLLRIVRRNQDCEQGRRFRFAAVRSVADYQRLVPCTDYEALRATIERVGAGEPGVLTTEPVRLLEPTGGSSAALKLVPYTRSLQAEFRRAIAAWIGDTFWRHPRARSGRAYWSITPLGQSARSGDGVPGSSQLRVGFEADSEYLGGWQRLLARQLMVAPPVVAKLRSLENARYATLSYLLAAGDLALVSVWSPLFARVLLDQAPAWGRSICDDLERGRLRLPHPAAEQPGLQLPLRPQPARAAFLRGLMREPCSADMWRQCWPKLALVSCWGDASSAAYLPALQQLLPQAEIQPKGLLATEGVVTIPWGAGEGAVLAVRSHFYEFLPSAAGPRELLRPRLAHELTLGERHRVLLTTSGGLYRYDLGDEVEVVGFSGDCPRLRFSGRSTAVSDLVGEKLHEEHVRRSLDTACRQRGRHPEFLLLVPEPGPPPHYRLYLSDGASADASRDAEQWATSVDQALRDNPQYRLARELGQLAAIDVRRLASTAVQLWAEFEQAMLAAGRRAGDLKPVALDTRRDWVSVLRPHLVDVA